ncbi:hyaluronidase-5-like [Pangasianodon hypophthalmus]|uniref:hyaluronidase-5-like n=1 Tax=Pangasianodon hypophthalmus TaxID=310915 RepID=UPI002307D560|nr:hyaluronidase-5-like [Pangasianodon hypophthalmus]
MCHAGERGHRIYLLILTFSVNFYLGTALSLPLTAAPIFKDTPFAVIWNAPTYVCRDLKIPLDFSVFQAVTTPASEPNQFLFLFYSNRLGLYPYTEPSTGRQFNGGIPQKGNLTASLVKAHNDISQYIPEFTPGLAVIDWEEWRPLWARNWASKDIYQKLSIQYAKENNPLLSPSEAVSVARQQFENAARAYMEKTMQLGIKLRPNYLWGFYLFPDCYNYGWGNPGYTGECPEIEKRRNNELLWLWESSTALFPSAYLPVSLREQPDAALFVRGRVKEAVRVSALPKSLYTAPIYVYLRPVFSDQNKIFLSEADLVPTIGESAALGASGVVLWGASADYNSKSSCEALAAYLPSTLNPYVANVTAAAKLCSQTLCQGHGRCVRQNPDSADYLYLNPNNFSIQQRDGKYVAVGVPSQSDLNVFVNRFTCQCYVGQVCSAYTSISVPKTPLVIQV